MNWCPQHPYNDHISCALCVVARRENTGLTEGEQIEREWMEANPFRPILDAQVNAIGNYGGDPDWYTSVFMASEALLALSLAESV